MIYLWRLEGQDLVLNLKEILKYPEFQSIYIRDNSNDKVLAKRDFKYIDFVSNRDSYPIREGFTSAEAHAFARHNSGMPKDYIPDKHMIKAIKKARELNGGVIEDLIDSTVAAFRVDAKLVKHVRKLMEKIEGEVKEVADVENVLKLTDVIINISNTIPLKISKLIELRDEYDKQKSKISNTRRGGGELSNSLDGRGIEELQDTGEVERMD